MARYDDEKIIEMLRNGSKWKDIADVFDSDRNAVRLYAYKKPWYD
ncbi:hypothetical protein [Streptococcus parauberis]|nr:hypothetical protein [Streptococcus parauberis]QBX18175.1 hypothetical protein Javan399_0035 [Streptococcus phage Javan399]KYP20804.1 hypothetical protein AKL13_00423 [Streptococcus parauberis]KYP21188.1 hypothetical protein TN39_00346 [Streptococcus parauberis]KYP22416.1 hypothetical protein AKL14_00416 [Streptococcus parauberis]KYP24847.1 hypothetical protein ADO04_01130 [Streptococcus parauberis]